MLYSEKHNVCVYDIKNPSVVTNIIKSAKVIKPGTVAVPCALWEMQVMRQLGFEAVSPIMREYNFPIAPNPRTGEPRTPFNHQYHMSGFLTLHPRGFNLGDIGTGKTLSTLWAADYLMRKGIIKKALVLSPLSTIYRVWQDEIFTNFLGARKCLVIHGSREKRLELLNIDADFYIINHDGLGIGSDRSGSLKLGPVAELVKSRPDINLIIVDEGSVYKDSSTLRYKVLRNTFAEKNYLWWLTGTPAPNGPPDAWAQAKIVRRDYQESYRSFQDRTMLRVSQFKWVPKPEAAKLAANILQPAIRYNRDDCLDLPECQYVLRDVELTAHQRKAYEEMKNTLAAAVGKGLINAVNEAALRMKLLQISLGAVYDTNHDTHKIDCEPRIRVMREIIEEAEEKILIFAPLTGVLNLLISSLRKDYSVELINGEVTPGKRTEIFRAFQQDREPRIIVADPRTMAHGLTLTAATTIIWYGPTDMPEVYTQANGRINRPGQTKSMLVVRLAATALEREIFKRLDTKQNMQGAVLNLIREGEI